MGDTTLETEHTDNLISTNTALDSANKYTDFQKPPNIEG